MTRALSVRSGRATIDLIRLEFESMMDGNGARSTDLVRHEAGEKIGQYVNEITEYVWIGYSSRAISHPVGAPAGLDKADLLAEAQWVIVQRPGYSPMRKGPFVDKVHVVEMLRSMFEQYPECMCLVIEMPHTSYPESGREWLEIHEARK